VRAPAGIRLALEITVAAPGDFAIHRLTIDDARVDPFFNDRAFSFKQGCPSIFDCRDDCEPEPLRGVDFPVDYLARDFFSFRRALLDFAKQRYPRWSEPIEADQAVMLMEIMAALGDEFAYTQDRIARELTSRRRRSGRSRSTLARLVDYMPDPGTAAETELAIFVRAGVGGAFPRSARAPGPCRKAAGRSRSRCARRSGITKRGIPFRCISPTATSSACRRARPRRFW
jgi:hypothetical protein